jgi:hypothetical protein
VVHIKEYIDTQVMAGLRDASEAQALTQGHRDASEAQALTQGHRDHTIRFVKSTDTLNSDKAF